MWFVGSEKPCIYSVPNRKQSYVSLSIATKIIVSAIAGGAGSGVTALPDYLYVTSKVYRSKTSGKIYTRYENKYYLNSARTKYVGSWTFSKRLGH